jgi:transposase
MILDQFWLKDAQFSKIAPRVPTDTRGKARVDDRRVISCIVPVIKSGGRWMDAPPEYGPKKTLYNRYVRWAAKGVWMDLFHALAQAGGPPVEVLIDSWAVKAHGSASGGNVWPAPSASWFLHPVWTICTNVSRLSAALLAKMEIRAS